MAESFARESCREEYARYRECFAEIAAFLSLDKEFADIQTRDTTSKTTDILKERYWCAVYFPKQCDELNLSCPSEWNIHDHTRLTAFLRNNQFYCQPSLDLLRQLIQTLRPLAVTDRKTVADAQFLKMKSLFKVLKTHLNKEQLEEIGRDAQQDFVHANPEYANFAIPRNMICDL